MIDWINDSEIKEVYENRRSGTFAGLKFAPGPVYYDGNNFQIADNWKFNSYNSIYGKVENSTFFYITNIPQTGTGKYKMKLTVGDYRPPTKNEYETILYASRPGSIVNGVSSCNYALITINDVTNYSVGSSIYGLLLFPDNKIINGKTLLSVNDNTNTEGFTENDLNKYLNQGCVFLPQSGYCTYNSNTKKINWYGSTFYLTSECTGSYYSIPSKPASMYALRLYNNSIYVSSAATGNNAYLTVYYTMYLVTGTLELYPDE